MQPIENECSSAPDMKVTCGRGRKADACHAQNLQDSLLTPDRDEEALTGKAGRVAIGMELEMVRLACGQHIEPVGAVLSAGTSSGIYECIGNRPFLVKNGKVSDI